MIKQLNKKPIIFDVTDSDFKKYVLDNSDKAPVFVLFINVQSMLCMQMHDTFTELATEYAEQFVLAEVDVSDNKTLVKEYKILTTPTLKVFIDSKETFSIDGELSEEDARDLLKSFDIISKTEEMRDQAHQLHLKGDTTEAIVVLSDAIKQDPSNTKIAMDMVQIFIDLGDLDQAGELFNKLPDIDKNSDTGLSLFGQLQIKTKASQTAGLKTLKENILLNPDDFNARLDCAVCELAQGNSEPALDQLFYIQEHKADYKEGTAKEMIIEIIDATMATNPEAAREYRKKLTRLLELNS
jgi:putative thioredoxin